MVGSIEMQNAMAEVNANNPLRNLPPLEISIGIDTSQGVIRQRGKYTIIHSGVNMPSRTGTYTTGDQILVSESFTARALKRIPPRPILRTCRPDCHCHILLLEIDQKYCPDVRNHRDCKQLDRDLTHRQNQLTRPR